VSAICSVRHGVANGAVRETFGPVDEGGGTLLSWSAPLV